MLLLQILLDSSELGLLLVLQRNYLLVALGLQRIVSLKLVHDLSVFVSQGFVLFDKCHEPFFLL